jgi:hypothetical protein
MRVLKQSDERPWYFDRLMAIIIVLVCRAKDEMGEFPLPTPGIMEPLER